MSIVEKVYRVTVRYPYARNRRQIVKYGSKAMVTAMWRIYRDEITSARVRGKDTTNCVFEVAVAPSAVFQNISALFEA